MSLYKVVTWGSGFHSARSMLGKTLIDPPWGSFFVQMDRSIFHDTRFQPASDQADQAWITDSILNKPGARHRRGSPRRHHEPFDSSPSTSKCLPCDRSTGCF